MPPKPPNSTPDSTPDAAPSSAPTAKAKPSPTSSPQALAVMLLRLVFAGVYGLANVLVHVVGLMVLTAGFVALGSKLTAEHFAPGEQAHAAQHRWFRVQEQSPNGQASTRYGDWLAQTDAQRRPLVTLMPGQRQSGLHLDEHGVYTLHADGPMWNSSSRYRLVGQQVVPVGVSYYYLPQVMLGFALALAALALLRWLFRRWMRRRQERDQATWLDVSSL